MLPVEIYAYIFWLVGNGSTISLTCKWWREIILNIFPNRVIITTTEYCDILAERGEISLLEWMEDKLHSGICNTAIRARQLKTAKWLYNKGYELDKESNECAARTGNIQLLEWVVCENCIPMSSNVMVAAAGSGNLEMVKWVEKYKLKWKSRAYNAAAAGGHIHILQYFHSQGREHKLHVCTAAAENGHLDTLKWLIEHHFWYNAVIGREAAACGHLHIIKWLYEMGIAWYIDTITLAAAKNMHIDIIEYLSRVDKKALKYIYVGAIQSGCVDFVKQMRKYKCKKDNRYAMLFAVESGSVDMVKYIYEDGHKLSERDMTTAVFKYGGNVDILKHVYGGCKLNKRVMIEAVCKHHLDIVKYLHSIGCPSPINILEYALFDGSIDMFIWLVNNGYSYNGLCETITNTYDNNYGILDWLLDSGYCTCEGRCHT